MPLFCSSIDSVCDAAAVTDAVLLSELLSADVISCVLSDDSDAASDVVSVVLLWVVSSVADSVP